jgi:hypothetical protein
VCSKNTTNNRLSPTEQLPTRRRRGRLINAGRSAPEVLGQKFRYTGVSP